MPSISSSACTHRHGAALRGAGAERHRKRTLAEKSCKASWEGVAMAAAASKQAKVELPASGRMCSMGSGAGSMLSYLDVQLGQAPQRVGQRLEKEAGRAARQLTDCGQVHTQMQHPPALLPSSAAHPAAHHPPTCGEKVLMRCSAVRASPSRHESGGRYSSLANASTALDMFCLQGAGRAGEHAMEAACLSSSEPQVG